ncbi:MAG TPA: efflux RND transporter permease subunit, partial [Bacteroidota bacterium]|nr:efflux RND transporter permease subunit [Bacteroidota bacterium]
GFIPGIVGRLYQQFAITIAISVILSAFVALSLTPALCTLLLRPTKAGAAATWHGRFFAGFNGAFAVLTDRYAATVKRAIGASRYVIILLVCICAGAYILFIKKPSGFIPTEDDGRLYVTYQLPEGSSTTQSVEVITKLMQIVGSTPAVNHYAALSGLNILNFGTTSNSGSIFCMLKPWEQRTRPEEQIPGIMDVMRRRIAAAGIDNANIVVIPPPPIRGIGQAAGFSMQIEQGNTSDDVHAFEQVVKRFVAAAHRNPAISTAFSYYGAHTPGYELTLDREKCEKLGVSIADAFTTMQAYMGSLFVNNFTLYDRTYHVVVQADTTFRALISDMNRYYVRNQAGAMLPLSTLITYRATETPPLVTHFNIFRSAEVDGSTPPGYSTGEGIDALRETAERVLPRGYTYEFSGLSYEEIRAGALTIYIFMFSITFVFLFLAALYESWSVPLTVLLPVPISAFGAILMLMCVPRLTNNVYAQIGLITLIGLSAKNAILIVEFAKVRVDRGEELIASTLEAVRLRLRPITMTSLAFILGVLPLVFATGAGAVARNTIGYTVLGGMVAASTIAILIVPVLFVVITRLSYGEEKLATLAAHHGELMERARRVEQQKIDPELEYDMTHRVE